MRFSFLLLALAAAMGGCADDTAVLDGSLDAGLDATGDSATLDGDVDGGDSDVGDGGTTDSSLPPTDGGCPSGEHMCSTGCERDRANEPSEGCRNGCGLECPGEDPICTSDGECSIECDPPATLMGTICCGGNPVCSTMVAARCPLPTEEPNETMMEAVDLGNFIDNDSMASISNLTLLEGDEDWYTFTATDSPSLGRTEFLIDVTVTTSMPGTMEVAFWFECADEDTVSTSHVVTAGTPNMEFGDGGSAPVGAMGGTVSMDMDCEGTLTSPVTDESGTVWIRVRRTASATSCDGYELAWAVHEEF
jgi:hypothetical protein